MRPVLISIVLVTMLGCSSALGLAGLAAQSTQAQTSTEADSGDDMGMLRMVMTALTMIANDILRNEQQFTTALAATLLELELGAVLQNQGELAALALLCIAPAPDDMPDPGVSLRLPGEVEVEGSPLPLDDDSSEEAEAAVLVVSGEVTDEAHPVTFEITSRDDGTAQVRVRGGGWLLCALFDADLEVDGVQWDLPTVPELEPTLEVGAWRSGEEVDPDEATIGDLLAAVEVVFTAPLPQEAVVELLSAEQLRFWLGDQAIDVSPGTSEPSQRFLAYLQGEELSTPSEQELAPPSEELLIIEPPE